MVTLRRRPVSGGTTARECRRLPAVGVPTGTLMETLMPELKTTLTGTPVRLELLEASDQQIEESLEYAEPLVLRGLLYQLTGDEDLVPLEVVAAPRRPGSPPFALADPDDAA